MSSWFLPLVSLFVVLADQTSKLYLLARLNDYQSIPVIPNIFHLTLVRNTGIAFGLFHGGSPVLLAAILLGIFILAYLSFKMRRESVLFRLSFGFILGGAIGNLIDRLVRGAVVDFLDFRIWPVFNVADSFITIGVGLLMINILFCRSRETGNDKRNTNHASHSL